MRHRNPKRFSHFLSLGLLLLLTACFNDAPYADSYSHIVVSVEGPGHVTMDTDRFGELFCTVEELCGYVNEIQAGEVIRIVAVPDEGHEFTGWTRRRGAGSSWNQDLRDGVNPLQLPADRDYWIIANFR
jgi:hypothetical protein